MYATECHTYSLAGGYELSTADLFSERQLLGMETLLRRKLCEQYEAANDDELAERGFFPEYISLTENFRITPEGITFYYNPYDIGCYALGAVDVTMSREELENKIATLTGGRVAEELIFDDITTGASQDIKQATATARSMITKYGMSENLGLVAYDSDSDEVFIGRDWGHTKSYSENVAAAIDEEVRQMIEKCHDQAKRIILEHSYVLHECAKQLMEKEKLSRAEFEAIFEQEAQMTGTAPEVSGEI